MLSLLPSLVVLFLAVAVILWAGTLVWQSYIYSEPVSQLFWRAPAASLALVLFVAFWCFLDYKTPEAYNPALLLFEPHTSKDEILPRFWSVKNQQEILFEGKKNAKGRVEYFDRSGRRWSPSATDGIMEAIVIEEDSQRVRFNAQTQDGKFKTDADGAVRYQEEGGRGRIMTDTYIGRLEASRRGTVFVSMLLCLLHLGVWFAGLWLLLRYQWSHAFGLAMICWLILTLIVMPMLFRKTEDFAREKAQTQTATSSARQNSPQRQQGRPLLALALRAMGLHQPGFSSMPRCA